MRHAARPNQVTRKDKVQTLGAAKSAFCLFVHKVDISWCQRVCMN